MSDLNNKRILSMLKRERENKGYVLECIKFYNGKIDQYKGASLYYIALRNSALAKIDEYDIEIDYLERSLFND